MVRVRKKETSLEKYVYLHSIQDVDEDLYFAAIMRYPKELFPLVYTPTVGEACQRWGDIYRHVPRGLYFSLRDRGNIRQILSLHEDTYKDVKAIVVTDGERILGLGDLGVNGMGIPIGKLALYTACGGVDPKDVLPVHLDVGTNNEALLGDEFYLGLKQKRERGEPYDEFVQEFMDAVKDAYGNVLVQFEDFGNLNAFKLLEKYRDEMMVFNDDIQGTASVVLSGLLSSARITGRKLSEQNYLFYGAGEAGVGIADLIVRAMQREQPSMPEEELRQRIWLMDSKGLITQDRVDQGDILADHKLRYAHPSSLLSSNDANTDKDTLPGAVECVRPTTLIGVSAQPEAFSQQVCERMVSIASEDMHNDLFSAPVIFALSNPTSKAEVTASNAYTWTDGRCVFASGSPFDSVTLANGKTFQPGQGNNAYVFPGLGLGAISTGATSITEDDFIVAAEALASLVSPEQISQGCVYPPLEDIRAVSATIAAAVANHITDTGRATKDISEDFTEYMQERMWKPKGF